MTVVSYAIQSKSAVFSLGGIKRFFKNTKRKNKHTNIICVPYETNLFVFAYLIGKPI